MDKVFIRNFFIFALLLTVSVSVLTYYFISNDKKLGTFDDLVFKTQEIITESEVVSANVKGMLASQRGFLLTGNENFLEKYEVQKNKVEHSLGVLDDLTKYKKNQNDRLKKVQVSFIKFSQKLEERAKRVDPSANRDFLEGVEVIDELNNNIIEANNLILEKAYDNLELRIRSLENKKKKYLTTLIGGVITGAVLLLIFNSFLLRAQRKRTKVEGVLKDTEDRLTLALEGTRDGIYDWDVLNDKVFYSTRFFEMLGYDIKSHTSTLQEALDLVHPDDIDKLNAEIEELMKSESCEFSHEFRMKHKSGYWVWIQSKSRALRDSKGVVYRKVGANTDITHLKHEQERLEIEKKKAEEANAAKSDFLAHMSHEIRTPLTAISGIAEILNNNTDDFSDKQSKLIQTLNSSTAALKEIVNDVLDFSKIESGELDLDEQSFPLNVLFAEVISMMSVRANEQGINFVCDDTKIKNINFYGDSGRLRQILVNLTGNAIKFTKSGGSVKIQSKLEDREGEQFLRVDVSDTGIGISPSDFDAIFERFKQADSSVSRKYGGTGLGLPISRNLARLMGGDIFLSSQAEQGSTFSVLLPMKLEHEDSGSISDKETNKKSSDKIQAALNDESKVLLVEDYSGNVVVIGYILEEMGLLYDTAETGLEAIEQWNSNHYDLVLMDVQMPEMDGFTATKNIRKLEQEKGLIRTPIIGMTAHALVGDKDKCIEAGMDAYLPKPIVEKDLKKEIVKQIKKA